MMYFDPDELIVDTITPIFDGDGNVCRWTGMVQHQETSKAFITEAFPSKLMPLEHYNETDLDEIRSKLTVITIGHEPFFHTGPSEPIAEIYQNGVSDGDFFNVSDTKQT